MPGRTDYNSIVVSPEPRGRFVNGIISGTPKPGTIMEVVPGTAKVQGKHTYRVATQGGDGQRPNGPIAILLEDNVQGLTVDDAYESGQVGLLYYPLPGDELLALVKSGEDTTSAVNLIVESGSGKLLTTTGTRS